jgi:hypothetical protein
MGDKVTGTLQMFGIYIVFSEKMSRLTTTQRKRCGGNVVLH